MALGVPHRSAMTDTKTRTEAPDHPAGSVRELEGSTTAAETIERFWTRPWTYDDVAWYLSVSYDAARQMKSAGKLPEPCSRVGGSPRWRPEDIARVAGMTPPPFIWGDHQ